MPGAAYAAAPHMAADRAGDLEGAVGADLDVGPRPLSAARRNVVDRVAARAVEEQVVGSRPTERKVLLDDESRIGIKAGRFLCNTLVARASPTSGVPAVATINVVSGSRGTASSCPASVASDGIRESAALMPSARARC